MVKYNLNFHNALQKIAVDFDLFNLKNSNNDIIINENKIKLLPEIITNSKKVEIDLQIKKRRFNDYDLEYWEQYGISLSTLKKCNVYPISAFFINKGDDKRFTIYPDKLSYVYVEFYQKSC